MLPLPILQELVHSHPVPGLGVEMGCQDLLTSEQGESLVRLARLALETDIGQKTEMPPPVDVRLQRKGATFVTITKDGALRGCIGTADAHSPLAEDVRETPCLLICPPEERPERVRPGIDGLLLTSGFSRGLLLPQVWKRIPGPEEFLRALCRKASLPSNAWRRSNTELYTFQVQAFHEE
jgi:AMMECR1 domain-containing protein